MTVQEVTDGAAALLGDAAKLTWTDDILLPYVKEAHQEIQNDLILNGFRPFEEISAVLTIPAGTTTLPVVSSIADFFLPSKMEEANVGSTDFSWMIEKDWEPDIQPGTSLTYWAFRSNGVHFIGATQDRSLRLYYTRGTLGAVDAVTRILNINNAVPIYTAKTAYLAATFKGRNPKASLELKEIYGNRLATYLTIEAKNRQALVYRRRPYSTPKRNI